MLCMSCRVVLLPPRPDAMQEPLSTFVYVEDGWGDMGGV